MARGGRAGAAIEHYFLFSSLLGSELEACGRWGRWVCWRRGKDVGSGEGGWGR